MEGQQEEIATTLMSLRGAPQQADVRVLRAGSVLKREAFPPAPPTFRAPSLQTRHDAAPMMEEVPQGPYHISHGQNWQGIQRDDSKSRGWSRGTFVPPGPAKQMLMPAAPRSGQIKAEMWKGNQSQSPSVPYYDNMAPRGYSPGASRVTTYVNSESTLYPGSYSNASYWGRAMEMQQQHAHSVVAYPSVEQMRDMNPLREVKSAPNTHLGVPPTVAMEGMLPMPQSNVVTPSPPVTPRQMWRKDAQPWKQQKDGNWAKPIPAIVIDSGVYPNGTQPKKPQPVKPFACDVCQKRFGTRSLVKRHKMIHSDSRPHPCPDCPKRFRQREHLIKHQRLHTGERPFKCPHCPMDFVQKSTMTGHIRTRHSHEKVVQCNGCGERFYTRNHLRNHRPKCQALAGVLRFM
mmetsp:Transcript_20306/g.40957  ORF Transcript_20306/g.40957 Transcript_20306/m.40957 type:complete len:402 (+) Transcript_20306:66-1271(+)